MSGHFVTFEGIEGSGKSTVARGVCEALKRSSIPCLFTREPGGTAASEKIRDLLLDPQSSIAPRTELLLYIASRAQLVQEVIVPALSEGGFVICDRFMDASVAYQGWARGLGEELVSRLNDYAVGDCRPELTFLLDLPVEEGFRRGPRRREEQGLRGRDRLELEDRDFHERVREGYLRLAEREQERIVVIDARAPFEQVLALIIGNIEERFNVKIK
jgi:dTMP kinase